jgi:hypothetical protein
MRYRVGDKVQIKTWEEIAKGNQVTEYTLINTEAINLPDGIDFGRVQDDKINKRCKDRVDEIVQVDKVRDWYYLKKSKTIVTGYVIKSAVRNVTDEINDRFEILDL